jgi:hypothetical protein
VREHARHIVEGLPQAIAEVAFVTISALAKGEAAFGDVTYLVEAAKSVE